MREEKDQESYDLEKLQHLFCSAYMQYLTEQVKYINWATDRNFPELRIELLVKCEMFANCKVVESSIDESGAIADGIRLLCCQLDEKWKVSEHQDTRVNGGVRTERALGVTESLDALDISKHTERRDDVRLAIIDLYELSNLIIDNGMDLNESLLRRRVSFYKAEVIELVKTRFSTDSRDTIDHTVLWSRNSNLDQFVSVPPGGLIHQNVNVLSVKQNRSNYWIGLNIVLAYNQNLKFLDNRPVLSRIVTDIFTKEKFSITIYRGRLTSFKDRSKTRIMSFVDSVEVNLKVFKFTKNRPPSDVNKVSEHKYGDLLLNGILGGAFGAESARWLLSNIFQGNIKINKNSPVKCYIPRSALDNDGYSLETTMPISLSSRMVFLVHDLDGSIFWSPTSQGNVFKVEYMEKRGYNLTTELDELEAPLGSYSAAGCLLDREIGAS